MGQIEQYRFRPAGPVPTPIPVPQPQVTSLSLTAIKAQLDLLGSQLVQVTNTSHLLNSNTYVHQQAVPSDVWTITHLFVDKFPAVSVVDSAGSVVIGDVAYVGTNQVVLTFTSAFSGKAYLN